MEPSERGTILIADVRRRLEAGSAGEERLLDALDAILEGMGCVAGTIHAMAEGSSVLELRVERGIPAAVQDRVRRVPVGKGMAGLAAERREPVQVCNLQTDSSGVAKAGARQTGMRGSIAVPIFRGGSVCGVFGVGRGDEHEFTETETALLERLAGLLSPYLCNA